MECEICDKNWEDGLLPEEKIEERENIKQYGRCSCCVEEWGTVLYPDQC